MLLHLGRSGELYAVFVRALPGSAGAHAGIFGDCSGAISSAHAERKAKRQRRTRAAFAGAVCFRQLLHVVWLESFCGTSADAGGRRGRGGTGGGAELSRVADALRGRCLDCGQHADCGSPAGDGGGNCARELLWGDVTRRSGGRVVSVGGGAERAVSRWPCVWRWELRGGG